MPPRRETQLSRSSDYSIFLGAPTRGEVERSLRRPAEREASPPPCTPVIWEVVHSTVTFPSPSPPVPLAQSPLRSLPSQPASSASTTSSSSQRYPSQQRSVRTYPPPAASSGTRTRVNPTPSPPKAASKPTPTPSPNSAEALGTYSFETSGPSSGRRGTTNRGPEWTPILTPPSQDGKRPAPSAGGADVAGRSLVGKGAQGLMSMVTEEDEAGETAAIDGNALGSGVLAASPFIPSSRPVSTQVSTDRGESPSRSRQAEDSVQDLSRDDSFDVPRPSGYDNVLTQVDQDQSISHDPSQLDDQTDTSLDVSQLPVKNKRKRTRTSVVDNTLSQPRSTRSRSQMTSAANLTVDISAAADESQISASSSYLQTQPLSSHPHAVPTYIHPKINPSHLVPLDAPFFGSDTTESQLPTSAIHFLAVILGVSLETIPGKDGRFWSLGKIKVHDGRKERVIECWEEIASEWCGGQGVRGKLRRLDVVWFQSITVTLPSKRDAKKADAFGGPRGPGLKATFPSSSYTVFYRCSDFLPHDAPEDAVKWRVDLSVRNTGVEMVRRLKDLVDEGTFGS